MQVRPRWLVRLITQTTDALARIRRNMLPPEYAAAELATMSWVALALTAFCELRLPEGLAGAPRSPGELAALGFGREDMLRRLLRCLSAYDVVRYTGSGRYTLGHAGKGLRGEQSCAAMARYANMSWHLAGYHHLAQSIATGVPGFEIAEGRSLFSRLADDEESGNVFDAAMRALSCMFAQPFASAYDFNGISHVVDAGGGTGLLLETVLARFATLRGTVVDRPHVVARGRSIARVPSIAERLDFAAGDIFTGDLPQADAYVLSHVLHDWNDEACARMLKNIARAMPGRARLLIYELVVPPEGNAWSQDRLSDLEMMAMLPGRERTRADFASLLRGAGLQLRRVIPTSAAESIVEAYLANRPPD